jgi:hypothetical protein
MAEITELPITNSPELSGADLYRRLALSLVLVWRRIEPEIYLSDDTATRHELIMNVREVSKPMDELYQLLTGLHLFTSFGILPGTVGIEAPAGS